MDYIRSKETESLLQKKWWHRLIKVSIWVGVLFYGFTVLGELMNYCMPGKDCLEVSAIILVPFIAGFFLLQVIYYKIVIYIVYGRELPK